MHNIMATYCFSIPHAHIVKPGVECSEENQNSVTVVITDPPLFLRREEFNVALELADRFRVTCTPLAAEKKNSGRYKNQVFDRDTATTTHQIELAGLRPDTDYKVDCEMDCYGSSGDVLKNRAMFTSAKASCKSFYLNSMHAMCCDGCIFNGKKVYTCIYVVYGNKHMHYR